MADPDKAASPVLSAYGDLLAWLAIDYECHVLEIQVSALCHQFDENDHELPREFSYQIRASCPAVYGTGERYSWTVYEAGGSSLDEAAAEVLGMMQEHDEATQDNTDSPGAA